MKHNAKNVARQAAKQEVEKAIKDHETKMHAKGGMVCRGMGAAKKGGKFVKNG